MLLLFLVHGATPAQLKRVVQQHVNDTPICFNGFVMDVSCINLGVLLEDPSVVTLQDPAQHSIGCLIDVP